MTQSPWIAPGLHRLHAGQGLGGMDGLGQHVLGQDQHHRARATIHGGCKCTRNVLGQAFGIVNPLNPLGHALGRGPKKMGVVHFLEGFPVARVTGHITHKKDHGCRILKGSVNPN